MSFKIFRDEVKNNLRVVGGQILPMINPATAPNLISGVGGGLAYDSTAKKVVYNDGSNWIPLLSSGGGGSNVTSYSMFKNGDQTVTSLTTTIITGWSISPSPPYHDNTLGWDMLTGIYTASAPQTLSIDIDISWKGGISNLGRRTLQIVYQPSIGPSIVVTETVTQADPNTAVETSQIATTFIEMDDGDQAWVQVYHDAPINLILAGGNHTVMCGTKIE